MSDDTELDVREVPKPSRHALIFAAYEKLEAGESFILKNDHEPRHLLQEFEREHPGSFSWDSLGAGEDGVWRVRIGRVTRTSLPRIVGNTTELPAEAGLGRGGSVWQLSTAARDLDANVITLPPGDVIETHNGPNLDVLIHVLTGSGTLTTEASEIPLTVGALVWLPPKSQRHFVAGDAGLTYFSVHHRKPTLNIAVRP